MKIKQIICGVLALAVMGGSIHVPAAQAAMVGTEQVLASATQQHNAQQAREQLSVLLARDDLARQLQAQGVDPAQVMARIDRLSDDEVMQLAGQLEQLPAGGSSLIGAAVLIFLVLLVTDILGLTDVFPFVNR